jgi:sugar lactone lactonase YvrE
LLVVSMSDRKILHLTARGLSVHADLAAVAGGDLNDMLTESQGSSYVGNFGYDLLGGAEKKLTDLHRVDADGNVSVAASGLDFPNGMAITDEGRTLIVAETWAHRLTAFDRSPSGALSNRRVFAELGEREPDGLQGDTEGRVWAACFHAGEFLRVGPGGVIDAVVEVPGRRAVACALGPEGRSLYCVTFTGDLADITKRKRTSSIEVVEIPR